MKELEQPQPEPGLTARSNPPAMGDSSNKPFPIFDKYENRLNLALVLALLSAGMLAAWLPVDWTRNLKRPAQAPNYAWLSAGYTLLYIIAGAWLLRKPEGRLFSGRKGLDWLALALLVLLPNLLNIWLRYSAPLSATDPRPLFGRDADMGLFYEYGKALTEGRWPVNPQGQYAEYPQLSFPFFWLGVVLSGSNREAFYWIFPLIMLACTLVAAAALYGLGLKLARPRPALLLAAWAAGCPALFIFNYTRFDMAPAALLLGAVYFALPGGKAQNGKEPGRGAALLSGLLVALGGLVKWLPGLLWPWLAAAFWRAGRKVSLLLFGAATLAAGLVLTLPWLLINSDALLYPYRFQGSRHLIGESFWFLVQRTFLDPSQATPEKPWGEPPKVMLGNTTLLLLQLALTGLVFGLSLWRLWRAGDGRESLARWAAAGLAGVAVFTLANRIFSPQYIVLLVWAWAGALVLRPPGRVSLAAGLGLMALAAGANFEVYLLGVYPDIWVRDSALLFGAAFGLSGWLLWRSLAERLD